MAIANTPITGVEGALQEKAAGVQVNEADKPAFVKASAAVYEEFGQSVKGSKALIDKALSLAK